MVPGAPVATSGILFAVPAFREWLRLSVRTTYHSPIPLSICGAPCRPALCPSRPPTFPLGSLSAASAPALCPHSICEASRRSALCPFRPPPVPSSVSFALRSFFCLARLFLFLTPSSIWMGISGEDFPRGQLFCIFPGAGFQHTLIYLIYIRSECRFRTPPGTVLFCRSDAAASLPVCLSACLLVRRTFHLNFFRLLHLSSYLPPDLFAPCHKLRPSNFTGRPSQIPAFRPSRHSPIRFFLRLPRPFSRLFPGNLPPRSGK